MNGAAPNPNWKIIVLPGLMGSTLKDMKGSRGVVWIDPLVVCSNELLDDLCLTPDGKADQNGSLRLEPQGLAPLLYEPLIGALTFTKLAAVEPFWYDWRRPIAYSAAILAGRLQAFLKDSPDRRVAIVAHSLGGLVAAGALSGLGPLREQVVGLVGFGVPWLGSHEAALNLLGVGSYVRPFADLTLRPMKTITNVIQTFWGLTDLLPNDEDVLDPELYQNGPLGSSPFAQDRLATPGQLIRNCGIAMLPVVGTLMQTPQAVVRSGSTLTPVMGPGDGIVSVTSAISGKTLKEITVIENHIMLPIDPVGILATVGQIGSWLLKAPYAAPQNMPLVSAHHHFLSGFPGYLKAAVTKTPFPPDAWASILQHW